MSSWSRRGPSSAWSRRCSARRSGTARRAAPTSGRSCRSSGGPARRRPTTTAHATAAAVPAATAPSPSPLGALVTNCRATEELPDHCVGLRSVPTGVLPASGFASDADAGQRAVAGPPAVRVPWTQPVYWRRRNSLVWMLPNTLLENKPVAGVCDGSADGPACTMHVRVSAIPSRPVHGTVRPHLAPTGSLDRNSCATGGRSASRRDGRGSCRRPPTASRPPAAETSVYHASHHRRLHGTSHGCTGGDSPRGLLRRRRRRSHDAEADAGRGRGGAQQTPEPAPRLGERWRRWRRRGVRYGARAAVGAHKVQWTHRCRSGVVTAIPTQRPRRPRRPLRRCRSSSS